MEEDDEFGDLYTDVLKPFTSMQSSTPQPEQPSPESAPLNRQIEINLQINDPSSNHRNSAVLIDSNQTLVPNSPEIVKDKQDSAREGEFGDNDVKFDIEDDMGNDPVIPGLLSGGGGELGVSGRDVVAFGGGGEGGDWDSDSEDDLQIVLNDDRCGPMGMVRGGIAAEDDDDDEDGDPLVILADSEPHQVKEEQEWGGDAGQGGDGERKEGEAARGSAGMGAAPKMGYSAHGFHPYSQFKYVRPGAGPMPASTAPGSGGQTGQVRPLVNMGPFAGRGRGDWRATGMRPPMQKGFNSSYGMHMWGAGRGFTSGLDFSLPSRKTIFEVDIDSFEEKPWKHPGVDISDFFNFGLNEETWKEYCKHLEQQRLESTMQSRIRVIDSGRTDQEYDPDMPPELAAATGVLDIPAENGNLGRTDVGHNEQARGSARLRLPIPTGRAIQVESGYGERLPSIDTRPPRIRDSDAVIEIVCQDNSDDNSSTGNDDSEYPENDLAREDISGGCLPEEDIRVENEVSDGFQQGYDAKQRELRSKKQIMNSIRDGMADECRLSSSTTEAIDHSNPARNKTQSTRNLRPSHGSPIARRRRERSPESASSQRTCDNQRETSVGRRGDEHVIASSSSPVNSLAEQESSADQKVAADDETVAVGEDVEMENEETLGARVTKDHAGGTNCSQKKCRTASQIGQQALQESDGEDSKAARSSENSKARSGSSKEYHKWWDNNEDEVVQDGHKKPMGRVKRHNDEREERVQRRDHDGRLEIERSHMVVRGRDDFHSLRDMDQSSIHNLHMNSEGFGRLKERDIFDGSVQRTEDDMQSRRVKNEDARKRERGEEVGHRHKSKAREGERSYKEENSSSRNQMDFGPYRVHYNKDVGSRRRERDNSMKIRYENMDDNHSKKRKEENYIRRDYIDKEEIWHGHRENTSRRKRDRDDIMDQRRRDEPPRIRENLDDHQSVRHKEEGLLQRGRGDRSERDDRNKPKQAHDEKVLNREKEEGRTSMSGRVIEDKSWGGHARTKDEYRSSDRGYQIKDPMRHNEPHQGRDGSYSRGNHTNYEEKKSRHDRLNSHNDHVVEAFDIPRGQGKRHKENLRKIKEPESGIYNTSGHPKKYQDEQSVRVTETVKGDIGQGNREHEAPPSNKQSEDASSSDDQLDTKRGRSKSELWRGHKERDFGIKTKSTSSLKFKEIDVNGTGVSLKSNRVHDESAKSVEAVAKEHPSSETKDISDIQSQDADKIPKEDRRLDTVEKLKKRSERFKLPLPSEKETLTVEKVETEALPSARREVPAQPDIKQERPARKRRWTGK